MYEPDLNTRVGNTQHGLICSKDERFKSTQKSALGPGVYEVKRIIVFVSLSLGQ